MIQGAINQLLSIGAAAKKAADIKQGKQERAIMAESRAQEARDRAIKRAQEKIQDKWTQKADYKKFVESLDAPAAPEMLKRIAYEEYQRQPKVRIGKENIDITKLSPEAQAAIRGVK